MPKLFSNLNLLATQRFCFSWNHLPILLCSIVSELCLNLVADNLTVLNEMLGVSADCDVVIPNARILSQNAEELLPKLPARTALAALPPDDNCQRPQVRAAGQPKRYGASRRRKVQKVAVGAR